MQQVLFTSAGGFTGSHLTEALVCASYGVRVFVHCSSQNTRNCLSIASPEVKGSLDIFSGDVWNSHGVQIAIKGYDIAFYFLTLTGGDQPMVSAKVYVRDYVRPYNGSPNKEVYKLMNQRFTISNKAVENVY